MMLYCIFKAYASSYAAFDYNFLVEMHVIVIKKCTDSIS